MIVNSIELCKGTKKSNVTTAFINSATNNDNKMINGNITILKEVIPVMVSIQLKKVNNYIFKNQKLIKFTLV